MRDLGGECVHLFVILSAAKDLAIAIRAFRRSNTTSAGGRSLGALRQPKDDMRGKNPRTVVMGERTRLAEKP
jgi:hypothetical protein